MTENIEIETEIESLQNLKKPFHELSYDQICELVNLEISKLGENCTGADLRGIDKTLGLSRGTLFDAGGFSDYLAFEEKGQD
jgi:hypothetical protein